MVNLIQEKYPSENGQCTGFKDGVEVSEVDLPWVGDMWPEKNSEPSETFIEKLVNGIYLLTTFT